MALSTLKTKAKTKSLATRPHRVRTVINLRSHLEKVLAMTEAERDVGLAAAAKEAVLGRNDIAYILQGFPPDLGDPRGAPMYLDEVTRAMDRLAAETARGRFINPATPAKLVKVCRRACITLPPAFENAVPGKPASQPRSKNGMASTKQRDEEICRAAHAHVNQLAANGDNFKKEDVCAYIAEKFGIGTANAAKIIGNAKIKIQWSEKKAEALKVRSERAK